MNLDKIERLYTNNLKEFGIDSRAVGWNSSESQNLRFKKLLNVIDNKKTSFSINELGCGYGELYKYLKKEKYNISKFNGYDISKPMLRSCKEYLKSPDDLNLYNSSEIKTNADFSIASGIFNTPFEIEVNVWTNYIQKTISNMFESSSCGIAFNLLSSYVDYMDKGLYYGDPSYFFNFCKTKLSSKVALFHDYQLYEWTIILKKY